MGTFSEAVDIECGPGCRPIGILWRGERYCVVAGRRRPFKVSGFLGPGQGVSSAEYELWELEVTHPERSRSVLSVAHRVGGAQWRLLRLAAKPALASSPVG
ncbi:MAG: hypothetical protein IIZ13_07280 [Renibacterium sp.]|nr:hypothetical protein [Renibacterium sp.]